MPFTRFSAVSMFRLMVLLMQPVLENREQSISALLNAIVQKEKQSYLIEDMKTNHVRSASLIKARDAYS